MTISILHGDCRETLKTLPECSVHMAVTSPPYWGLRAYLPAGHELKSLELGSEATPDEFVANLVGVFRSVRRVLRDDGTCWVNIGDTYNAYNGNRGASTSISANSEIAIPLANRGLMCGEAKALDRLLIPARFALAMQADGWTLRDEIIWHKPAPMPSSVDGVRWERCRVKVGTDATRPRKSATNVGSFNEISGNDVDRDTPSTIWSDCPGCPKCRKNDGWVLRRGSWRTTAAHEMIYMFAKTRDYFCDAEAVRVPSTNQTGSAASFKRATKDHLIPNQSAVQHRMDREASVDNGTANPRSVWTISPEPLRHKHYAAYPSEIPRRCILAGTSAKGVCAKCGAPWARMVEKTGPSTYAMVKEESWRQMNESAAERGTLGHRPNSGQTRLPNGTQPHLDAAPSRTIGWRPTCDCNAGDPVPATVLDPFGGSGTTAIAAKLLGRNAILCELNPEYVEIQRTRFAETAPLLMGCGSESQ